MTNESALDKLDKLSELNNLTVWEQSFIEDLIAKVQTAVDFGVSYLVLSENQAEKLEEIYERHLG